MTRVIFFVLFLIVFFFNFILYYWIDWELGFIIYFDLLYMKLSWSYDLGYGFGRLAWKNYNPNNQGRANSSYPIKFTARSWDWVNSIEKKNKENHKPILKFFYDSDLFWFISLYLHLRMTSLVNNLRFICINNIFFLGFNFSVLILNRNPLWQNRVNCLIIEANEY